MPFPALTAEIPYGLDQLAFNVMTGDTPGANVLVPGARSLTFNVTSDSDTLEGDNTVIATVRTAKSIEGSVEFGRINSTVFAAALGGTVGTSGSTPAQILTLDESSAPGSRYIQIIGQAKSQDVTSPQSGYRVTILKAQVTSGPDETLTVNDWNTPTMDFTGIAISGVLMNRKWYETYVALT